MRQKLISSLIASMFVAAPALAAEPSPFLAEGSVSVGAITTNTDDDGNPAKLHEYRDLRNGVLSNVFVRGRGGDIWFDAYGENFGRDDQFMALRGGMYGAFKYRLYSDSLRHEFLENGRIPYAGAGGNTLTAQFPMPNPDVWNRLNMGYKRTDNGGFFEWQSLTPWYIRVDANEVKFDGTKNGAASNGTSPGNGFVELSFPVDYSTKNVTGEFGYNTGKMNVAVSWLHSQFQNNNDILRWSNPFWGSGVDTTFLPPDNDYDRLAVNATWRSLPYSSTFAARYAWSKLTSDTDLATTALNGTGASAIGLTNPNVSTFNGKHIDQVLNLTLRSAPMKGVDTRVFYNFYDRNNESTLVEYRPVSGLSCGTTGICENELFSYRKHNFGLEGYWRFIPGNRIGAGYEYWKKDYEGRPDYDESKENKFFVEWKNNQLDNVGGRIKYTYLERRSNFLWSNLGTTGADADFLSRFVSAYDLSDVNRHEVKASLDWTAMPNLDFSFAALWKENNYQNITFGRTKDKRYELYGSVNWGDFQRLRVSLFGDVEEVKYDANHRYIGAVPCNASSGLLCNDPSQPPNALAYNWSSRTKDKNWMVGVGADFPVNEQLLLKGSVLYVEADGSADFSSQCGGTPGLPSTNCPNIGTTAAIVPFPIANFDDSKRTSFNLKGIYTLSRNWAFTLGYAYERYRYDDVSYNGYTNTIPFPGVTNNTSQSYLTGYGANPNYTANIVYGYATFRF